MDRTSSHQAQTIKTVRPDANSGTEKLKYQMQLTYSVNSVNNPCIKNNQIKSEIDI